MDIGESRAQRGGARAFGAVARFYFASAMIVVTAGCDVPLLSTSTSDGGQNKSDIACTGTALPNQYIVKWKNGDLTRETAASREALVRDVIAPNQARIEYFEPNHRIRITPPSQFQAESVVAQSNDWGQTIVDASGAWNAGAFGDGVIVAVVDSGADITHPQLANQLAANPGETGTDASGRDKASNGVDDDGNGLIDDAYGYDFVASAPLKDDGNGHGTHVSGIILADPAKGMVKGIASKAKLLPLKFMDDTGSGDLPVAIRAIQYAASRGARVINASWGGTYCSQAMKETIAALEGEGVLFVAAAGNNGDGLQASGMSLESLPVFPAAIGASGQITIGASTSRDYMAGFSNFSYTLVDLVAPGSNIFSTYPGGGYKLESGTSMATPFVSGAAALLFGAHPTATVAQVKAALLGSVDRGPFAVASQGRLNVKAALDELARTAR